MKSVIACVIASAVLGWAYFIFGDVYPQGVGAWNGRSNSENSFEFSSHAHAGKEWFELHVARVEPSNHSDPTFGSLFKDAMTELRKEKPSDEFLERLKSLHKRKLIGWEEVINSLKSNAPGGTPWNLRAYVDTDHDQNVSHVIEAVAEVKLPPGDSSRKKAALEWSFHRFSSNELPTYIDDLKAIAGQRPGFQKILLRGHPDSFPPSHPSLQNVGPIILAASAIFLGVAVGILCGKRMYATGVGAWDGRSGGEVTSESRTNTLKYSTLTEDHIVWRSKLGFFGWSDSKLKALAEDALKAFQDPTTTPADFFPRLRDLFKADPDWQAIVQALQTGNNLPAGWHVRAYLDQERLRPKKKYLAIEAYRKR